MRESVFAEWRETAEIAHLRPLCLRTRGDKSVRCRSQEAEKSAVRFIAARHLPRYRSARGVVRHRDIFSDPTMSKRRERERAAAELTTLSRIGKARRSALTSGSSLHCRHPDDNDADACTHDAEGTARGGVNRPGRPSTKF